MTVQPNPNRGPFERFLLWLSPDRELALKKHDEIMKKIVKYFVRKGCPESEELAGETRDRVIRIINDGSEYPNPDALFYSIAAKMWREYAMKPKSEPLPLDDLPLIADPEIKDKELQAHCLERCLAQLPDAERDLITRYYQGRGLDNIEARKQLVAEQGGENTLRVKAFRIRIKLRTCISNCLTRSGKVN